MPENYDIDPIVVEAYSDNHKLSEHFTFGEFTTSQTATRLGIDNYPSEEIVTNMKNLCLNIMEPIRTQFGIIIVSSGYRSVELNKAIGGSETSQHTKGEAVDFISTRFTTREIFDWVILDSGLDFDQIIWEFGGKWIHISYTSRYTNRNMILTAFKVNGHTEYTSYTRHQVEIGDIRY